MGAVRWFPLLASASAMLAAGCASRPAYLADWTDPSFAPKVQRRFDAIAVLPFRGDEALSRPAEEQAGVRLGKLGRVRVLPPFAVARLQERAIADAAVPATRTASIDVWTYPAFVGTPPQVDPAQVRAAAEALGVDAFVVGRVDRAAPFHARSIPAEPAQASLLLLDGKAGTVAALVGRVSRPEAATLGLQSAAADALEQALDVLVGVLALEPGAVPSVALPRPAPAPKTEEPSP